VAWRRKREPETWEDRAWRRFNQLSFYVYTTVVVILLLIAALWPRMFITVPAGHHGVMYRYFLGGTVTDEIWGEGVHVIPPWDTLTIYESRLQEQRIAFSVLSDEGLDLDVLVSVRFRADRDMLGYLHQDVGPDYYERLVRPEVMAHVRRTFGNRPAHEIYSSAKDVLPELRNVPMITRLGEADRGYIIIQEIRLVDVGLPEVVEAAIAEKYRQEQLMLEYRYRLEREEQEAERKRIEAKGIHDYNEIAGALSPDVLRWRDIEATMEVAKAPSSKVIMLGGGDAPVVFSMGVDPGPPAAAPASPAPAPAPAAPAP
jgi:regulator of protease activity HflC (stomatin/prohibitin superfamily)